VSEHNNIPRRDTMRLHYKIYHLRVYIYCTNKLLRKTVIGRQWKREERNFTVLGLGAVYTIGVCNNSYQSVTACNDSRQVLKGNKIL